MVGDKLVGANDALAERVPLPDWLDDGSVTEFDIDIIDFIDGLHPDDRTTLIELYRRAVDSPAQEISATIRWGPSGHQRLVNFAFLNLSNHPDVGSLLVIVEMTDTTVEDHFDSVPATEPKPVGWMVMEVGMKGSITTVNGDSRGLLGYDASEMIGRMPSEFVSPEDVTAGVQLARDLRDEPSVPRTFRRRWIKADGSEVWVQNSYARRKAEPGQPEVLMVMWDISDVIEAERAAQEAEADLGDALNWLQTLADLTSNPVFSCDAYGELTLQNSRLEEILKSRSVVGRIHNLFSPESAALLTETMLRLHQPGGTGRETLDLVDTDGSTTWRLTLCSSDRSSDADVRFMGSLEDVTETVHLSSRGGPTRLDPC